MNETIKNQVKQILLEHPETWKPKASSLLVLMVWQRFYPQLKLKFDMDAVDSVANPYQIIRARQRFNHLGIFQSEDRRVKEDYPISKVRVKR